MRRELSRLQGQDEPKRRHRQTVNVPPPSLIGVLETVLYYRDQDRALGFYRDVLGMRLLSREPGRSLFFRAGSSVYLLFDADATRKGGDLPPHGADGVGHVCFQVAEEAYDPWKRHLTDAGVEILQEVRWPDGLSFYFHDTEGNLLEIADRDIWPR